MRDKSNRSMSIKGLGYFIQGFGICLCSKREHAKITLNAFYEISEKIKKNGEKPRVTLPTPPPPPPPTTFPRFRINVFHSSRRLVNEINLGKLETVPLARY
ncbi:hypothetical protein M0802_011779 [Mischocyttarus mexicanus]|nr:hypothetical protein M0802_011779 [Mischocyttarus mexicanus]